MDDVIREFLLESHENLAQLDADLVALEQEPHERETLARVFRTLHTVKGTAGFLGFSSLQAVSHAAEHLLTRLRSGTLTFNPDIADALLAGVDAIREMLSNVESQGVEGEGDYQDLIRWLQELEPPAKDPTESNVFMSAIVSVPQFSGSLPEVAEAQSPEEPTPAKPVTQIASTTLSNSSPSLTVRPTSPASSTATRNSLLSDSAVRVDVQLLDRLMTIAEELVLARNQILQHTNDERFRDYHPFLASVQHLNRLTSDLQSNVMQTRMQPISSVWNKLPRVVRDLATACGKQVSLEVYGQETELDKTVIEAIRDPLTHIIRNAIDHGIESPDDRRQCGKREEGTLTLSARHSGGTVTIEIRDDGAGIHPQRIREKAFKTQLISADEVKHLSDQEILKLVFTPGFSTTDQVTQFSGRGVGMDVVRNQIEAIGGTVELESQCGVGTTLRLKLPLTLAIIPALIVSSDMQKYCVPMTNVEELLLFDSEASDKLHEVCGAKVFRVRDEWLPIVDLRRLFAPQKFARTTTETPGIIVVVQAEQWRFGILIDAIHDTEEIVVKPLQQFLKALAFYSGATVLGDGRVALILDIAELATLISLKENARSDNVNHPTAHVSISNPSIRSLVVALTDRSRIAIPLNIVDRIEETAITRIEVAGGKTVLQYGECILPIYDLETSLGPFATQDHTRWLAAVKPESQITIIICTVNALTLGIAVPQIVDIAEEVITREHAPTRESMLFNAVTLEQVTEYLDPMWLHRLAQNGMPQTIGSHEPAPVRKPKNEPGDRQP